MTNKRLAQYSLNLTIEKVATKKKTKSHNDKRRREFVENLRRRESRLLALLVT